MVRKEYILQSTLDEVGSLMAAFEASLRNLTGASGVRIHLREGSVIMEVELTFAERESAVASMQTLEYDHGRVVELLDFLTPANSTIPITTSSAAVLAHEVAPLPTSTSPPLTPPATPPATPPGIQQDWPPAPPSPLGAIHGDNKADALLGDAQLPLLVGITVAVAFSLVVCALLVLCVRRHRDQHGAHKIWTPSEALTAGDVGKRLDIVGDRLLVDGFARTVRWRARRSICLGVHVTRELEHTNVGNGEIAAVQEWVGGKVVLRGGKTIQNPAKLREKRYEQLAMRVGMGGARGGDPQAAPVRLIKAQYFLEEWAAEKPLCARCDIREDSFYDGPFDDANLLIIAIAVPSPSPTSPYIEGFRRACLNELAPLLNCRLAGAPASTVVVYLDTCSLKESGSPAHEQNASAALLVFAHPQVEVWCLHSFAAPCRADGTMAVAEADGWVTLFATVGSTIAKGGGDSACLDLGNLTQMSHQERELITAWPRVSRLCAVQRRAPPPYDAVSALLEDVGFVHPSDLSAAMGLYARFLSECFGEQVHFDCRGMDWSDVELTELSAMLHYCRRLRSIDLSFNPLVTDSGAAALASALPVSLSSLDLRVGAQGSSLSYKRCNLRSARDIDQFVSYYGHTARGQEIVPPTPMPLLDQIPISAKQSRSPPDHDACCNLQEADTESVAGSSLSGSSAGRLHPGRSPDAHTVAVGCDQCTSSIAAHEQRPRTADPLGTCETPPVLSGDVSMYQYTTSTVADVKSRCSPASESIGDVMNHAEAAVSMVADVAAESTVDEFHSDPLAHNFRVTGHAAVREFMLNHDVRFHGVREAVELAPRATRKSRVELAWSIDHLDEQVRLGNKETIKGIAAILKRHRPMLRCRVHGETGAAQSAPRALALHLGLDPVRDVQSCMEHLARLRAQACVNALVAEGVPREQLSVSFLGQGGGIKVDFIPEDGPSSPVAELESAAATATPFAGAARRWLESQEQRVRVSPRSASTLVESPRPPPHLLRPAITVGTTPPPVPASTIDRARAANAAHRQQRFSPARLERHAPTPGSADANASYSSSNLSPEASPVYDATPSCANRVMLASVGLDTPCNSLPPVLVHHRLALAPSMQQHVLRSVGFRSNLAHPAHPVQAEPVPDPGPQNARSGSHSPLATARVASGGGGTNGPSGDQQMTPSTPFCSTAVIGGVRIAFTTPCSNPSGCEPSSHPASHISTPSPFGEPPSTTPSSAAGYHSHIHGSGAILAANSRANSFQRQLDHVLYGRSEGSSGAFSLRV